MMFWLGEACFAFALLSYVFAVLQKRKVFLTLFFMLTNMFFCFHYLCFEKYGTLILLANEIVLLLVLFLFEKYKVSHIYTVLCCVIVFVADIIAIIFTWTEAISLMPLSASMVFLFSLAFRGVLITKISTLYSNTIYIIYLSLIGSYVAVGCQCFLLCGSIIGLAITIQDIKAKRRREKFKAPPTVFTAISLKPAHMKKEIVLSNK